MLDAAAAAVAWELADLSGECVQVGAAEPSEAAPVQEAAAQRRSPATELLLAATPEVDEHGVALLDAFFDDADPGSPHTVTVDWGDGSRSVYEVQPGVLSLGAAHQYLDEPAGAATGGGYAVAVRLVDAAGAEVASSTTIAVNNVAPSNLQIHLPGAVDESGAATLELSFDDPGMLDAHTIEVDWGDGSALEVLRPPVGSRHVVATHGYLDDDPAGTPVDDYVVNIRVADDDGGAAAASARIQVSNVAPSNLRLDRPTPVDENGLMRLAGSFEDPGTQDAHLVEIDWGDGSALDVLPIAAGERLFAATHRYLDDNPSRTASDAYAVSVRLIDDDGGETFAATTATVHNVGPTNVLFLLPAAIDEHGVATLELSFDDPGSLDRHTVTIDWGDGTPLETVSLAAASRSLVATHRYLDDDPTGTADDVYAVRASIRDDDGGVSNIGKLLTVRNVAPMGVTVRPTTGTVDEGAPMAIEVSFADPGTRDEHAWQIDWGDGTATAGRVAGRSFLASHVYADDGDYAVTVSIVDDDGGEGLAESRVAVANVAPTLRLSVDESRIAPIDEGGTTQVRITGVFSDPGFDNPLNAAAPPGGVRETAESFEYEVDWGDGHTTGRIPLPDVNGSPGTASAGAIGQTFAHQYVDNDLDGVRDARYAVRVTVYDDDGGFDSQTFDVIVYNVNPTLKPVVATDVNIKGETTLTLLFDDPAAAGFESFQILVDWGDRLSTPDPLARFAVEQTYDGPTPQTFTFTHVYAGPPDPLNPAAKIVISVKIRDDDFGTATSRPDLDPLTIDGQSNIETVAISNPGTGKEAIRIDTTPSAPPLTFPERPAAPMAAPSAAPPPATAANIDVGGSAGDSQAASERYFELRVINPDGTMSEGYRLRPEALDDLPGLFRNLPDNHYAIFLVQSETNVRRLVIEVYVRNGKLIDPGDDTEGARDRPPTDDAASPEAAPQTRGETPSATIHRHGALAGMALALAGAGRQRRRQLDDALANATPQQWNRLKTTAALRRHKPR